MEDYGYLQQKYVVNTYVDRQITLVKGRGVFLFDEKGQKYLDLMSNYGVSIFGYNHPAIVKSLTTQLKLLTTLHGSFNNNVRAKASQSLSQRCGEKYSQVYWSNSGAEAIEAALKFAILATGKRKFIVCDNGYHGKTLGALSATAGEKYKKPFKPLLWKFLTIPFDDIHALQNAINADTAGFIVEPIQGEGGIFMPKPGYLKEVQGICNKNGVLLIVDEIQTGVGRTGEFIATQKEKVFADILCLGKGLAGGIPVGATIVNRQVASAIPKHIHTSTFGGNPLACAGVLTTLKLLNSKHLERITKTGGYFLEKLLILQSQYITQVRGSGLMLGLALKENKRDWLLKLLQKEKILAIPAGENVVRFLPPYIIEKRHIDFAIEKLKKIFSSLS